MNAKDLTFVRIITAEAFGLIPRYLIEQIKDFEGRADSVYAYGLSILMTPSVRNGVIIWIPNPLVHITALIDKDHIIKGVVWVEVDLIYKHLVVHALSLDKEYQSAGSAVENMVMDYIFKIPDAPEFRGVGINKKAQLTTTRPKAYEKFGCKRSKRIIMEIEDEWRRKLDKDN